MSHFTAPQYCQVCKGYMGRHNRMDRKTCSTRCRKALSRKLAKCDSNSPGAKESNRRLNVTLPLGTHINLDQLKRDMITGSRFRLLDLCCCAGGGAVGYALAGFSVTGIDAHIQPDYPFKFIQADALDLTYDFLLSFDAIHASPPCQAYIRPAANPTL